MVKRHYLKVLDIDLTSEKVAVNRREDLTPLLGGIGAAAKLFSELVQPELTPLDPAQPVILARGPLSSIYPVATKVVAVFRSPLTGEWGESYAGMRLALAMRLAGYDAVIIRGRASKPTYLSIGPDGVRFRDASALTGLPVEETGRLLRKFEPGRGFRSCIRIGAAGEKQVAFAGVNVDTYRHFGRLGLGAVFGSKQLKAVVIFGDNSEPIPDPKSYTRVYQDIYRRVVETEIMEKYHGVGTAINVNLLNQLSALPTRNLQQSSFEWAAEISGEAFAEHNLVRKLACSGCPVGCIHIGLRRREFDRGYEFESRTLSYDHELIFALGSFLGIKYRDHILDLIDAVEQPGLDAISTGVALGWVTEAFGKGLVTETDLGTAVEFGSTGAYLKVIENIVAQPNEFYRILARGTRAAAARYGGQEFALTLAGTEMAGYHTGYTNILGLATGARHSHLDNAGYSVDQKNAPHPDPYKMTEAMVAEEKWRNVLNSLVICLFAREVYNRETVLAALEAIGISMAAGDLDSLGNEIFRLKQEVRKNLGFNPAGLTFPDRFFQTPSLMGRLDREFLNRMLSHYLAITGSTP